MGGGNSKDRQFSRIYGDCYPPPASLARSFSLRFVGPVAAKEKNAKPDDNQATKEDLVKLERLCRYISRPVVSKKRLSLSPNGNIRYWLKTPYRDGTTHVIFEPLDFIARLVSLVPKPRVNLTRFHGVFAPNSKHRAPMTPAKRDRGNKARVAAEPPTPAERR